MPKQQELDADICRLYPHTTVLSGFTKEQAAEIEMHLGNYLVKQYFRNIANLAIKDIVGLRLDRHTDVMDACATVNKLNGYLEIVNRVINEHTWER